MLRASSAADRITVLPSMGITSRWNTHDPTAKWRLYGWPNLGRLLQQAGRDRALELPLEDDVDHKNRQHRDHYGGKERAKIHRIAGLRRERRHALAQHI